MRIPLRISCPRCGKVHDLHLTVNDSRIDFTCDCGEDLSGALDVTIGHKLLQKSWHECEENTDYSLSVVLAAMAFECELARLYIKWTRVNEILERGLIPDEELEERLRSLYKIDKKIEQVSVLMFPNGLTAFLGQNPTLSQVVADFFPSLAAGELANGIRRNLFWPRNRVLHLGKPANEETARKSYNIAKLAIKIFEALDQHRRSQGSNDSSIKYDY